MFIRRVALIAGIVLSGCATMDENECRTADWYEVGLEDGLAGEPAARLARHGEACAEYGTRPDERRYRDGREAGLLEYCSLDNAFRTGLKGKQYRPGVCPAAIDWTFREYNEAAYRVYRLRNEIDSTHRALDDKHKRLNEKKLSDERREKLRKEILELERSLERLRDDLENRERDLDRLMGDASGRGRRR